jgi:hypothetical protein
VVVFLLCGFLCVVHGGPIIVSFSLAFETVFLFLILDYGSLLDIIYGIIDFLLFIVIFYLNLFTFASMIYEYS